MTRKAKNGKRIVSMLLCLSMLLSLLVVGVSAAEDYSGELLQNPGFENTGGASIGSTVSSMAGGWVVYGGGYQKNNPHSGSYGFYLNNSTSYHLYQEVTVPYTGLYNTSAYIAQGRANAKLGIRMSDGTVLEEITLPTGCGYSSAHTLDAVLLTQGDKVQVYAYGGNNWVNGDDFSFTYDFSNVTQNLLEGMDLSSAVSVRAPWAGPYILTATVEAGEEDAVVTLGSESATVAAGTTETVKLTSEEQELNAMLDVSIGGTITEASLIFDVSVIPNEAPEASDVAVSGYAFSGESLSGSYTFSDADEGQKEATSTYRWLACDTVDGEYTAIEGATSKNYTLTGQEENKYIKFEVTPVDSLGKAGEAVQSEAVGPVVINWISNPGLELSDGSGWNARNGGGIQSYGTYYPHRGVVAVKLPAGDEDAEMAAPVAIERTAYYCASGWVYLPAGTSTFGVRISGAETPLAETEVTAAEGHQLVTLTDIPLEKGSNIEVYIVGNTGTVTAYADDFALWIDGSKEAPAFANLVSFSAEQQIGSTTMDTENNTITFHVPYGTDVTKIVVEAVISEGAVITPAITDAIDFTDPVTFTISNGELSNEWTVTCEVNEKKVALESDNETLADGFNWAVNKTEQFVMTGVEDGTIDNGRSPNADYIPSYWAGYYNRTAFYSRDFVHQATGAELVGLSEENYSMFEAFAKSANESRKWYALWALNFDGSAYYMDYNSDSSFVREVPAQFELVEKAYKQFLWSGDERYISDEMFEFYTHVMVDYVALHDSNGNGVAEGTGGGIFSGSCTYNERGGQPIIEAGDAIGSQYQATLAYAGFCAARGDDEAAAQWYQKAADLKKYFNEDWGVMEGDEDGNYVRALSTDGTTKYNDFGKENSWFMPLKMITEPGEKTDNYIDWILEQLGDGIGTSSTSPSNIEAYTYIPDMLFLYNRSDDAWKWMSYILSIKDNTHENAAQGTNGDYPEISYTLVSQTVEGMMGVTPNAQLGTLTTVPRLPSDVGYVTLKYQEVGDNEIRLTHKGNTESTLTNVAGGDLSWEIQFYGEYPCIRVDGEDQIPETKQINGLTVSYVTVPVEAGATVTAVAVSEQELLDEAKAEAKAELEAERASYDDADYRDDQVAELNAAAESGLAAIEAAGTIEDVTAAVETAKAELAAVKADADLMKEELAAALKAMEEAQKAAQEAKEIAEQAQKAAEEAAKQSAADKETAEQAKKEAEAAKTAAEAAEAKAALSAAKYDALVELNEYAAEQTADVSEILKEAMAAIDAAESAEEVAQVVADAKEAMDEVTNAVCPSEQFTDVAKDGWYHEAVDYMIENGYMNGVSKDQFNVNGSVTRAQLVTILYRLEGEPSVASLEHPFADVADGAWYNDAVIWAYDNEIVKGVSDTQFAPDKNISRQQIVTILYRYCGADAVEKDHLADYTDAATVADYAAEAMNWAIANGIVNGMNDTTLAPNATASRAQIATILMRYLEK